ncbi:hypothetical protein [Lysobacter gummosus]
MPPERRHLCFLSQAGLDHILELFALTRSTAMRYSRRKPGVR